MSGGKRCLFVSMCGGTKKFNYIDAWCHKDFYLYRYVVAQKCLFISMCGATKYVYLYLYVVAKRYLFTPMSGESKMFIYIYVWWHKDVYLHLCLVKQKFLFMSSMCDGTKIFIYI